MSEKLWVMNTLLRLALVFLILSTRADIGRAGDGGPTYGFDDLKAGSPVEKQYDGVVFPDLPIVVDVAGQWPKIGTASGPNALYKKGAGPLTILFSKPQSRVRVYVGNPLGVVKMAVVMRAYDSQTPKSPVIQAMTVYPDAQAGGIQTPLELSRVLDQDIVKVEIEYSGQDYTVLDDLNFEIVPLGNRTVIDFDHLPASTLAVKSNYAGVVFPDSPVLVNLADQTYSAPYAIKFDKGEVGNVEPMRIELDPPQGAVRVRVGNPTSNPLHVTMKAYSYTPYAIPPASQSVLLGTAECDFDGPEPISTPLTVYRWAEQDINRVEVLYSGNQWEIIDQVEFAPNPPAAPPADTIPPQVFLTGPTNGEFFARTGPATTFQSISVNGVVQENAGMAGVVVYARNLDSGVTESVTLTPTWISGTNYTFASSGLMIHAGRTRVWAVATDNAGNTGTTEGSELVLTFDYARSIATSISPHSGSPEIVLREAPRLTIPGSGQQVTILGTNLHSQIEVTMEAVADPTVATYAGIVSRAADLTSMVIQVPPEFVLSSSYLEWRVVVHNRFPGIEGTIGTFTYTVSPPYPYPQLYGFGFANEADWASAGEFWSVFGADTYDFTLDARTWTSQYIWWPIYRRILNGSVDQGSCVGMASTSLLLHRRDSVPESWDANVRYAAGFTSSGKPGQYQWPDDAPPYPINLWGYIRMNHGIQFSAESIGVLLDQSTDLSSRSISGDPMARLIEIRAHPTAYVICLTPSIGHGHAVAPYSVIGNRIYVYDSNKPYNNNLPASDPANQEALNSYIDIDPGSNQFSFPNLRWTGTGLYAFPIDIWSRPRTLPGLSQAWDALVLFCTGSADGEYSTPEGKYSWGWKADGSFVDSLPGTLAVNPFNPAAEASHDVLGLVPTKYPALNVTAHVRTNGDYFFLAAQSNRVLQVQVLDAQPGDADGAGVKMENHTLSSVSFRPMRDGARFVSKVGLIKRGAAVWDDTDIPHAGLENTHLETLFQWSELAVPMNGEVEFRVLSDSRGVELINRAGQDLHPRLLLQSMGGSNAAARVFGPLDVPQGSVYRTTISDWPANSVLAAEVDLNGDGIPEIATKLTGRSVLIQDNPGGQDRNNNGILDEIDIGFGSSTDKNHNGIPDEIEPTDLGAHLIQFEELPAGTVVAGQYPGLQFSNAPAVINVSNQWPGLATISPSQALYKAGPGPIRIEFATPQSRVRVYVGNPPGNTGKETAVLRAYGAGPSLKAPLLQTARSGYLPSPSGVTIPLEVIRPLDQDISAVEVEFPGRGFTLFDNLEYEIFPLAYHGTVDFDQYPDGRTVATGATIQNDYPGVSFPALPYAAPVGPDLATYTPPNALRNRVALEASDPDALIINFDPPQGIVRLQVGNPYATPQHIVMRAYSYSPYVIPPATHYVLLNTNAVDVPPFTDIAVPIEIMSWAGQDIGQVQIEYSGNQWEYIDHLEFAPNAPATTADTNPPRSYFDSPANGTAVIQSAPPPTPASLLLTGHVWEDQGLKQVSFYQDHAGTNVLTDTNFLSGLQYPTPPNLNYTFARTVNLLPGSNHFRIIAVDNANNVSTNAQQDLILFSQTPEPLVVTHTSPEFGNGRIVIRDSGPYLEVPATNTQVTLTGTNLHDQIWVWLLPEGTTDHAFYPTVNVLSRAPDLSSITVEVPAYALNTPGRYHWWVWDYWPAYNQWTNVGTFTSTAGVPYPRLWGFGFHNTDEVGGWGDFCGVFGDNAYIGPFPDPFYLLYLPVYVIAMDLTHGACVGMASTSIELKDGYLTPESFNGAVHYPSGFLDPGKPDTYEEHVFSPWRPINLWSHITVNKGVQFSREVIMNEVFGQMRRGNNHTVWGNPTSRLDELRMALGEYILCMVPSPGTGHAVVPYDIQDLPDGHTHIMVYDSNRPYHNDQAPDSPANQDAVGTCVDVDRNLNTYSFNTGSETWSGTGLYLNNVSIWEGQRHAPGLDLIGEGLYLLLMVICGNADGYYSTADGGQWGWDQAGNFTDSLPGAASVSALGLIGETNRNVLLVVPTNYSTVAVKANVRQDGSYIFHSVQAGRLLQLEVLNPTPGDSENLAVGTQDQILKSFTYTPTRAGTLVRPKIGLALGAQDRAVFHWEGLDAGAGDKVEFRALIDNKAVELVNHSGTTLHPQLMLQWVNGKSAAGTNGYGTLVIPPGASHRLTLANWPDSRILLSEMDLNGDGKPDVIQSLTPASYVRRPLLDKPRFNANRVLTLRVYGDEGAGYVMETSANLLQWVPVATNTVVKGRFDFVEKNPTDFARFYRVRNAE